VQLPPAVRGPGVAAAIANVSFADATVANGAETWHRCFVGLWKLFVVLPLAAAGCYCMGFLLYRRAYWPARVVPRPSDRGCCWLLAAFTAAADAQGVKV